LKKPIPPKQMYKKGGREFEYVLKNHNYPFRHTLIKSKTLSGYFVSNTAKFRLKARNSHPLGARAFEAASLSRFDETPYMLCLFRFYQVCKRG